MIKLYRPIFIYEDTPKSKDNTATDSQIFLKILLLAASFWPLAFKPKINDTTFAKASANKVGWQCKINSAKSLP
jgi:hypothetical protein